MKEVVDMQIGRTVARTILPLSLAVFIAAGCSASSLGMGGIPDDAVCTVNGTALTKKEFAGLVKQQKESYKSQDRDFPKKGTDEYDQIQNQAVDFLIQRELMRQQADKLGVTVSEKKLKKGVKDLKQQAFQGDEKAFKKEIKRLNLTEEDVDDLVRDQILSEELYKKITKDVKVSDKDAKAYFEENRDQFVTKESREVAHILVKDKATADKVYAQVSSGDKKAFAAAAKKYSQDPGSKDSGGVLPGGVQRGATVPEFEKAAFALKVNEVSKPVKSTYGYHVIQARSELKPESKQTFKDVEDQIKQQLQGEKESERFQNWMTDVRKDAEDQVECRKGYVWTQTVDSTDTAQAPAGDDSSEDEKSEDKDKADEKKSEAKDKADEKKADAEEKADEKKADAEETSGE